jgi:hypothetical protein
VKKSKKHLIGLANEFISGTPYRIPFGMVANKAADGKPVIQRLSRENAEAIANELKEAKAAQGDQFPGLPVYIGHPDHAAFKERDKDLRAYGWANDATVSEDALEFQFDWPPAGAELLENKHFKFLSPNFIGVMSNEKIDGVPVVDIVGIRSIGLTNNPNWPGLIPLVNEEPAGDEAAGTEEGDGMTFLERLAKALGMDPTASEDAIAEAIEAMIAERTELMAAVNECWPPEDEDRKKLGDKPSSKDLISGMIGAAGKKASAMANEKINALEIKVNGSETAATESATQIQLANAKFDGAVEGLVESAIKNGIIVLADRDDWKGKLTVNFANAALDLVSLKKAVKTEPNDHVRKPGDIKSGRSAEQLALVNELLPAHKNDFSKAWMAAKSKRPDLFEDSGKSK